MGIGIGLGLALEVAHGEGHRGAERARSVETREREGKVVEPRLDEWVCQPRLARVRVSVRVRVRARARARVKVRVRVRVRVSRRRSPCKGWAGRLAGGSPRERSPSG